MNWHIAKIVFRIVTAHRTTSHQFDEHLRLVSASSPDEAVLKARMLGLREENASMRLQTPQREFINVLEVQPLAEVRDGVELTSSIHEPDNCEEYIRYVHLRAADLQTNPSPAHA